MQMNLLTKQKQIHRHRKHVYDYQSGWGVYQEHEINRYTSFYIKQTAMVYRNTIVIYCVRFLQDNDAKAETPVLWPPHAKS